MCIRGAIKRRARSTTDRLERWQSSGARKSCCFTWRSKRNKPKNNTIDTRTLTSNLFNYLHGNERALQLVRVPTEEQEQARWQSRQHDQLVEERKRLGAKGNALLLSRGFGSWKNWWRPKAFSRLSQLVPERLLELVETWVDLLRKLDEKFGGPKWLWLSAAAVCGPKG